MTFGGSYFGSSYFGAYTQAQRRRRFAAILNSNTEGRNPALLESAKRPEIVLVQSVVVTRETTIEGAIVEAIDIPWDDIVELLLQDPSAMFQLDPRQFEEIIAGAYDRQGYEVTLTPRSNDGGRDVIALGGHPKPANDGHLKTGQR